MDEEQPFIIEFTQVGHVLKITAIDPVTGKEVSMVGNPAMSQAYLARQAAKKLRYVLNKKK